MCDVNDGTVVEKGEAIGGKGKLMDEEEEGERDGGDRGQVRAVLTCPFCHQRSRFPSTHPCNWILPSLSP